MMRHARSALATIVLALGVGVIASCSARTQPSPSSAPPPSEPSKAAPSSDDDHPDVTAECEAEAESAPPVTREQLDAWTEAGTTVYLCLVYADGAYSVPVAPRSESVERPPLSIYDPAGPGDDACFPLDNDSRAFLTDRSMVWATTEIGCDRGIREVPGQD